MRLLPVFVYHMLHISSSVLYVTMCQAQAAAVLFVRALAGRSAGVLRDHSGALESQEIAFGCGTVSVCM
jgi:hypothetical protein